MNNSSGITFALVLSSAGLITSTPIDMIVNNNSQLNDLHYLSGADLNVVGTTPSYPSNTNKTYYSRIIAGTISWMDVTPSVLDTSVTGFNVAGWYGFGFYEHKLNNNKWINQSYKSYKSLLYICTT